MENKLIKLDYFQRLLTDYLPSAEHQKFLQKTKLILLLAPSGTGRNTLIHEMVNSGDYYFVVSDTTRKPRINNGQTEQNGVEYWFKTEEEMLQALEDGEMLEAEIIHGQQVSGMSIRELKKAHESHKTAITDIDIGGAMKLLELHPDAKVVLLIPPNFEEWLKRLQGRGTMPHQELRRRLQTALRIYQYALDSEDVFIVINDEVARAKKILDRIAHGDDHRSDKDLEAVLNSLLYETENWLHAN